jgi:hypothetical protein
VLAPFEKTEKTWAVKLICIRRRRNGLEAAGSVLASHKNQAVKEIGLGVRTRLSFKANMVRNRIKHSLNQYAKRRGLSVAERVAHADEIKHKTITRSGACNSSGRKMRSSPRQLLRGSTNSRLIGCARPRRPAPKRLLFISFMDKKLPARVPFYTCSDSYYGARPGSIFYISMCAECCSAA